MLEGKGVFVAISPRNFPLTIFLGHVSAALAAGNSGLAKPAEQTPLIAHAAVELLLEAGIPGDVLAFLPGRGETVGAALTSHDDIIGVAFTGSTEVARMINRSLAGRDGPIATLIEGVKLAQKTFVAARVALGWVVEEMDEFRSEEHT